MPGGRLLSATGVAMVMLATSSVFAVTPTAAASPQCFGKAATIVGTGGNNEIIGTDHRDVIVGFGGNDTIKAKGGHDFICAGAGADTVDGGLGSDQIAGGPGAFDLLEGGPSDDVLDGGPGPADHATYFHAQHSIHANLVLGISRGEGHDRLLNMEGVAGGRHNDVLLGNNGPDNSLWGGVGNDVLRGRGGEFDFLTPGLGDDLVAGGAGFDILDGFFAIDFVDGGAAPAIQADTATGTMTGQGTDEFAGIELVGGTDNPDQFIGGDGHDEFFGFGGNDVFSAWGGNDHIQPGLGDDQVDGGKNDALDLTDPEAAGDIVFYTEINATAPPPEAGVTVDLLAGTASGLGSDTLTGIETAVGTNFDDVLRGDDLANGLQGLAGSDLLEGGDGDDLLDGDELVFGTTHPGTDTLDGGVGTDICLGGEVTSNCESTMLPPPPPRGLRASYARRS